MIDFSKDSYEKKLAFFLLYQKGIGRRTVKALLASVLKNQIKPDVIREHVCAHAALDATIKKICLSLDFNSIESFYTSKRSEYHARDISVLFLHEKTYPKSLHTIEDAPLFLFCRGKRSLLKKQGVAIVGTRKITTYGRVVTEKITEEIVLDGYQTISGCMYGVDELAHRVTLKKNGNTIAVLGYGLEHAYPTRMQSILDQIISSDGLVLSEYFPDEQPHRAYFVARNRIIAGLSHSVVVTEAAQKSGSHSTALFAAASGRTVYAVPGPITNPYSEGTKWLINQGATVLTSGFEIAEYRGESSQRQKNEIVASHPDQENTSLEEAILSSIRSGPASIDMLVFETQKSISSILVALSALELQGRVVKDGILWYLR